MGLRDAPILVLDCQATGASPEHGHLLEIGWAITSADRVLAQDEVRATLLALPEGATIPKIVGELTGVKLEDLAGAPGPAQVWQGLRDAIAPIADAQGLVTAIVHFARFEQSFLAPLHAREHPGAAFPLRMVCTHEIARRLFPGLPRRGLRALAGWCGHAVDEVLRARGHVWATALVWRHLAERLDAEGIRDFDALAQWLAAPAPRASKREYAMPREKRLGLPDAPGVYRMLRVGGGDVLYVGKATSLRDRVNSYFRKQTKVPDKLLELLSQARDLEVTPTASILEAALLETDEIKRCAPPFNQALLERGRAPWFATDGLAELAPLPSATHRLGPLGSQWSARRFTALAAVLTGELGDDAWRRALLVAAGRPGLTTRPGANVPGAIEVDDAVLREGLAAFVATLPDPRLDLRRARAVGAALWRAQLAAGAQPEEVEEAPEVQIWTAADVHEHLAEAVMMIAYALRRATWLRALSESSIAFVDGRSARRLIVEHGQVVERGDHDPAAPLAPPPGWQARDRTACFDIATFDRLRVLTTELRRIAIAGGEVTVRLGPHRVLAGDRLRRLLAWV